MMADSCLGLRLQIDQRQKSKVRSVDLLEEAVDFGRVPDIVRIHYTQNIGINSVLLQEFVTLHCLLEGRLLVLGDAVSIVHFLRAV